MSLRHHPGAFIIAAFAALACANPAAAGGTGGIGHDTQAKMHLMQARQNYESGQRRGTAPDAGGSADPGAAAGGTGNLTIGDFSQADTRALREVNILVDGDIINLNKGR